MVTQMVRKVGSELISFAASCIFCSEIPRVLAKSGLRENDPFAAWNMASFDTFEVEGSGPESVAGSTGVPKLHKLVLPGFSRKEEKLPLDELMDVPEEELPKKGSHNSLLSGLSTMTSFPSDRYPAAPSHHRLV